MGYNAGMLERAAQEFRADMWGGACEDAVYECGIAERRFGPVQANVIESLPEAPALNVVLGAAESGAVADGHLAAATEWADSFHVDYRVQVGRDRPESATAEDWLNRHGFEQGPALVRYVRHASMPDLPGVPGVKVWEISENEAGGETMVFDAAPALGMPAPASSLLFDLPYQERWRIYTAELEDSIVAFGSMMIHDGVAVLGLEATVEGFRRRGCNQALLRQRLIDAYEAGCETVFAGVPAYGSENISASARNLIRAGFVAAHESMNWQRPRAL
ncbi:MAG TPA: hypothetical protein VGO66_03435 [Solirubrobacterales bacterium]|jgi:hypothetical protein|nr:hypothetical protein [Solirubrobacterales bacterium]